MFDKFKEMKDDFKYLNPNKVFDGKCEVHEINEGADDLRDALGIINERYEQLKDICIDAYETCDNGASAGAKMSKQCNHPNELFLCAQMLAEILIKARIEEAKDKLLNQLRKGGLKGFPGLDDL